MLVHAALCVDRVHRWSSGSGRSRGIRGGGQALLSPSSPPALLPPPLVPALAPARFHLSHKVLQPTAFVSSFSFAASSQQPAVRLNHSRISSRECALPSQKRHQVCCATHLTFPSDPHWGDPGLAAGALRSLLAGKRSWRGPAGLGQLPQVLRRRMGFLSRAAMKAGSSWFTYRPLQIQDPFYAGGWGRRSF